MKSRLFYKTFATYLLILVLTVGSVYFLLWREIKTSAPQRAESELMRYAGIIDLESRKDISARINQLARQSEARVTLMDETGKVLSDSEKPASELENHLDRPEIQEARLRGKGRAIRYSHTLGVDMLYVALPVRQKGKTVGYVRLARPLYEVRHATDRLYWHSVKVVAIMIVPAILIALLFAYRLTAPIKRMERFTDDLRHGRKTRLLLIRAGGEMRQLAENLNYLVQELQSQVRLANEEKEKLEAAYGSMKEGVLILDRDERIETFNTVLPQILSARGGDITGRTLIEAFRNIELQNALARFKEAGEPLSREIAISDPTFMVMDVSIAKIRGEEGKTILVFHDITRLKLLERMRVDFVANVTHEIKTPLTAILGFVETLREGAIEDGKTARRFLEIIENHANRLNRLLDDLLTISNIELGDMRMFFESVSLSGVSENVVSTLTPRAIEKSVVLQADIPEDLPLIRADRDRLVQILLNVVDNAVKFTPEGGRVSIVATDEKDGTVSVRIMDTGIGIPANEIARLGERFYRVDRTRSRELGGTGLGLSIVKHLMAVHEGKLEIQSRLGQGTTVSLRFPVYSG